jgi:hypothetical protein
MGVWRTVAWRKGTNKKLRSRFARVRVRVSPIRGESRFAEETLLIEWPKDEAKPTKYWLATGKTEYAALSAENVEQHGAPSSRLPKRRKRLYTV